jgi:glycosyltransferase involved in cell wall biosynthesis
MIASISGGNDDRQGDRPQKGRPELIRVLITTNLPVPYRMDFFNELGKLCRLRVLFERRSAATRDNEWLAEQASCFEPVFLHGLPIREDGALCPSILKHLKPKDFDAIIVDGYSSPSGMLAIEALRARRAPFFLNCDGGFIKSDSILAGALKRRLMNSATWGLASGTAAAGFLRHYGPGIKAVYEYPFTSVRQNDIALQPVPEARKQHLRASLRVPGSRMALCVGRYLPVKGFELAIEAWRGMPESDSLVLVGSGPEEADYRRRIREYGLRNVHIHDFKQKRDLWTYYDAADILLFPTRGDVWGLVVNEALARGLPVVTTERCGGALDMLADGRSGTVVPSDDVPALHRAVAAILDHPASRSRMAEAALAVAGRYTIEAMASRHMEIFKAVGIA